MLLEINKNRTNTENELFCCGMFLELKKAFDTVNHSTYMLYDYGIRDIMNDWFSSYLSYRFRLSRIDSYISNHLLWCPTRIFSCSILSFISVTYINALISLTFNFLTTAPTYFISDQSLRSLESLAIINGELKNVTN